MRKEIAINIVSGVSCTIRANPGVHSPSNVLTPPDRQKYAQTAFIQVLDLPLPQDKLSQHIQRIQGTGGNDD